MINNDEGSHRNNNNMVVQKNEHQENPPKKNKKKKRDGKDFTHFIEGIIQIQGEEETHNKACIELNINTIDEYYQSIQPHHTHSENRLFYFDRLCVSAQYPPLLNMKLFPNGKEITESFSSYYSIRDFLEYSKRLDIISDGNVICYVIGDGNVPRTAAVFASATNWRVLSIDPR